MFVSAIPNEFHVYREYYSYFNFIPILFKLVYILLQSYLYRKSTKSTAPTRRAAAPEPVAAHTPRSNKAHSDALICKIR